MNILIVEDEGQIRSSIEASLRELGFTSVLLAGDGEQALARLREERVDLVLSDIRMPGMDGIALLEAVRREFGDLLFVVLSGYDLFSYAQQAIRLGAFSYLLKPLDREALGAVLQEALRELNQKRDLQADELEARIKLREGTSALRKHFVTELVNRQLAPEAIARRSESFGLPLHLPGRCVWLAGIEGIGGLIQTMPRSDIDLLQYGLENLSREVFRENGFETEAFRWENGVGLLVWGWGRSVVGDVDSDGDGGSDGIRGSVEDNGSGEEDGIGGNGGGGGNGGSIEDRGSDEEDGIGGNGGGDSDGDGGSDGNRGSGGNGDGRSRLTGIGVKAISERIGKLANDYLKLRVTIAIGSAMSGLPEAAGSYDSAKRAYARKLLDGPGRVYELAADEPIPSRELAVDLRTEQAMTAAFESHRKEAGQAAVGERYTLFRGARTFETDDVRQLNYQLLMLIRKLALKHGLDPDDDLGDEFHLYKQVNERASIDETEAWFRELISECFDTIRGKSERSTKKLVEKAKTYMAAHFHEDIGLEAVAGQLYISAEYLSREFKKEQGENFVDYLLGLRIAKAKEYLVQGRYKTYEIAKLVGFKDEKYFSKVFKKTTGFTPSDYKFRYLA